MNSDDPTKPLSLLAPHSANPILPGYYADPSLVQHGGKAYLYATLDPWGGKTLGCWESDDFKNWIYRELNWPTKAACTSPTSKGAMVWAPSVVRGADGRFYMVVSVGNEIWVGGADHPLGPWRNLLGDRPLIPEDFRPGFHMIDAEYFVDDDGSAWLYWGSGLEWVNGRCWAVKLKPDMVTFDGEVHDVTPENYFEAPFMVKEAGLYYLMYSAGNTTKDTYQVHYAVGDSPLGPFTEAPNSPILATDREKNVLSPGHHAVFRRDGRTFILYHRHSIPFDPGFVGRQVCVDELCFSGEGVMEKVLPTHEGPAIVRGRRRGLADGAVAASSEDGATFAAARVLDGNFATRWRPAAGAREVWLLRDLGEVCKITRQEIFPEYAWKPYRFRLEISHDGTAWRELAGYHDRQAPVSPIRIEVTAEGRFLRMTFLMPASEVSIFAWEVW